jgi:hypothetical protein
MTKKPAFKQIELSIAAGRQDVKYKLIGQLGEYKIKIEIRSDSYAFQCYARVYVWKDLEWSFIDSIHHAGMSTKSGLVYTSDPEDATQFKHDKDKLIDIATKILF